MKNILGRYFFLFVFALIITNCSHKKSLEEAINEVKKEDVIKRQLRKHKYTNGDSEDIEIYINLIKDTVFNQVKVFKNGGLDTLRSNFYDLKLISIGNEKYKGKIIFYSKSDSLLLEPNTSMELSFEFAQSIGDSLYFKKYTVKNENEINFEYTNFLNETVMGNLFQTIKILQDSIPNEERKVTLILQITLVDNKIETINPLFNLALKGISE